MAKLIDITGKALSGEWGTDDETGGGIPVLRTTNFTNEGVVNYNDVVTRTIIKKNIDDKFLRKGDIVIEKSGGSDKFPVGRVIYFDGEEKTYLFNNFTGLLRVKDQDVWYPRYIFYSLYANYRRGGTRAFENKTTGLHNLKTDDYVSKYEVDEIDKIEQILICEKLDKLYEIIKSREWELQLLDDLIKARFVEMFGARNYLQAPISELVTGKVSNVKNVFSPDDEIKYIDISSIDNKRNVMMGYKEYVLREAPSRAQQHIKKGDIVISTVRPNLRNVAMTVFDDDNLVATSGFCVLRAEKCLPEYLLAIVCSDKFTDDMTKVVTGANYPAIKDSDVMNYLVSMPPMELQEQFADFVHQVDKSKFAVQKSLKETKLLFDSLMQQYFG